ncbi:MAG: beta-N-acetylhexosaminidase [Acidobacteria bacterium]|nr:MAG: beta-N-acetylhexosaminidase [Acidobacteriota bacterium]
MARTSLDLRTLAGQLLTFGFDGTEVSGNLSSMLKTLKPGGIILFARNIESPRQTHALLKAAQKHATIPLFRCVDMEGGTVDRLKNIIGPAPSVQEVATAGCKTYFREHGRLIGSEVSALGFNVDFAPVLDLRFEASLTVMGSRTVSKDAKATVAYAREFLRGLKDVKIAGCGKHFPGLGEGKLDSHQALPVVNKSWKALWAEDLVPYQMLAKQLPFVMVAHCAFPEVTGEAIPASISKKWIGDVLRKKIGYTGLVVSDDLEMGGVLKVASIEEAAVATVQAGADMYLVCHNEELVQRAYEAILNEAERSARFRAKVETAALRILTAKKRWPALTKKMATAPSETAMNRLRQKMWTFGEEVRLTANVQAAEAAD